MDHSGNKSEKAKKDDSKVNHSDFNMDTFECPECTIKFETVNQKINNHNDCHLKVKLFTDDDGQKGVTQANSTHVFEIPQIQPKRKKKLI